MRRAFRARKPACFRRSNDFSRLRLARFSGSAVSIDHTRARKCIEKILKTNPIYRDAHFQRLVKRKTFVKPIVIARQIYAVRYPEMKNLVAQLLVKLLDRLRLKRSIRR